MFVRYPCSLPRETRAGIGEGRKNELLERLSGEQREPLGGAKSTPSRVGKLINAKRESLSPILPSRRSFGAYAQKSDCVSRLESLRIDLQSLVYGIRLPTDSTPETHACSPHTLIQARSLIDRRGDCG